MAKIITHYKGDMLFESKVGNHTLLFDVPYDMGGGDRAPTPPQVFVASLGACISAFVAHYCEIEGIETQDMAVEVEFDKVEQPTRLVNLKVTLNLPHGDCKDQEKAIYEIAQHCPVPETIKTLEGIGVELVDKSGVVPVN